MHVFTHLYNGRPMRLLIDAGAKVDAKVRVQCLWLLTSWGQNHTRETPLYWAAEYQNVACVRTLINAGARLIADTMGRSPFHAAFRHSAAHPDVVRELLRHPDAADFVDKEDGFGNTPLCVAVMRRDIGTCFSLAAVVV